MRYYLRQTILGCQYLHNHRVIHRDLKLGNLFLSDDMEVKIGKWRRPPSPGTSPSGHLDLMPSPCPSR